MITLLQIALLLILIALIGIIIGFLFGKLSCKKQQSRNYIEKNEYCENEFIVSNALIDDVEDENLTLLNDNKNANKSDAVSLSEELNIENKKTTDIQSALDNFEEETLKSKNIEAESNNSLNSDNNKPLLLTEPINGKADNLCRIKGIGFVIEEKLHNLGIYHFEQIAAWTEKEVAWVDSHLSFSGRIIREDWIGQAKKLASGEESKK